MKPLFIKIILIVLISGWSIFQLGPFKVSASESESSEEQPQAEKSVSVEVEEIAGEDSIEHVDSLPEKEHKEITVVPLLPVVSPRYTVQTAAFSYKENSKDLINRLKRLGIDCRLQKTKRFYIVYCGAYSVKKDAGTLRDRLASAGYRDAFVLQLKSNKTTTKPTTSIAQPGTPTTQAKTTTKSKSKDKILEQRVTLNFKSMRLDDILVAVSRQTGANFITNDEIRDLKFRAFLKDVTLKEALQALLSAQGLVYEQSQQSNIYVVKRRSKEKPQVVTRVFQLKFIQLSGGDSGSAKAGSKSGFSFVNDAGGDSKSSAKGTESESADSSIVSVVQSVLSESGRLQIDPYTNSLIITDLPDRFDQITEIIEKLDVMTPQIFIEGEILEINSDTIKRLGIEYGLSDGTLAKLVGPARVLQIPTNSKNRVFPSPNDLDGASVASIGQYGNDPTTGVNYGILSFMEFQAVLKAVELSGEGKFLAKPKIMTLNNKPALISVTSETAVGVESASLISQSGLLVSTAERYTTGITLQVTPQVNDEGYITLIIKPMVSRPRSSEFFPGQFVDPQSTSLMSTVRVRNGQTVLIGGLLSTEKNENNRKVPFLSRIPLLGYLFKSNQTTSTKKDLMIFITPRKVVDHE